MHKSYVLGSRTLKIRKIYMSVISEIQYERVLKYHFQWNGVAIHNPNCMSLAFDSYRISIPFKYEFLFHYHAAHNTHDIIYKLKYEDMKFA